jgi:7-carboxy-7-deazaguanine synthase
MPRRPTLRIAEIFVSLQGEGLRQGEPTVFVRLAGCNLRCAWCDTKFAWRRGGEVSLSDILTAVRFMRQAFPATWVCLTGGEPLLQDVGPLLRALRREGFKIQVETNGTRDCPPGIDWLTVSPKPPRYAVRPALVKKAREVKLVVSRDLTRGDVAAARRRFPASTPLILQPHGTVAWSLKKAWRLLAEAARRRDQNVRLMVQLHKVLKVK